MAAILIGRSLLSIDRVSCSGGARLVMMTSGLLGCVAAAPDLLASVPDRGSDEP